MARVTIQAVADEAGLSKFAVSRALAGKSGVSEKTRERVNGIAARLGYKKSAPRARLLSVVFDDTDSINSELHMQIQAGFQREAAQLKYNVRVHSTHLMHELEAYASQSHGMMIVGPHSADSLMRAQATGTPIVRNGWLDPLEPVDQVGGTDREGGSAVARYLFEHGHRTFVYVHGDTKYRGRMERLYGLRETLEELGGSTLFDLIWSEGGHFTEEFDRLKTQGHHPTAFFCAHDGLAVTVISQLLAQGYQIPKDASVVGFGDFSAAQQILPHLTTVKMPGIEIGRHAVRLLHARISDDSYPGIPLRIYVPSVIVERDSAGPVGGRQR